MNGASLSIGVIVTETHDRPAFVTFRCEPGGRLVANAVTIEGEQTLLSAYAKLGGSLTRIAISRAEPIGPFSGWRPLMPVTQLALLKT